MKTWFTSLNGSVTLSALALLSFIGYVMMESRYYLEKWIPGDSAAMVETVIVLLIVGGWLRALFVATRDSRRGLTALFALNAFTVLIALYDLQFTLTPGHWPERLMWAVMGIVGVIAAAALVMQLRQKTT